MEFSLYLLFYLLASIYFSWFQLLIFFSVMGVLLMLKMYNISYMFDTMGSMFVYFDLISGLMSMLSFMIIYFILLFKMNFKMVEVILNLIFVVLFYCFVMNNFLMFYIMFEFSLVPLLLLILVEGSSLERFKASSYLLLFTLTGSLLLLLVMMMTKKFSIFIVLVKYLIFSELNYMYSGLIMLVFLIKMPMYSVHMWLPKAHVEASVAGSMLLAGILLKLGGYGINRLYNYMFLYKSMKLINFFSVLSLFGSFVITLICLRQVDMKLMIAYSSVSHMSLMLGALLSGMKIGLVGSVLMMLGHGFCSSGMFFISSILYLRYKTRNMFLLKGSNQVLSCLMMMWGFLVVVNMGVPPFMNFMAELLLIFCLMSKSFFYCLMLSLIMFFGLLYNLNMFLRVGQGFLWKMNFVQKEVLLEVNMLFMHMLIVLIYMLKFSLFICGL